MCTIAYVMTCMPILQYHLCHVQFGRKLGDWGEEPKAATAAGFGDASPGRDAAAAEDENLAAAIAASLEDAPAGTSVSVGRNP